MYRYLAIAWDRLNPQGAASAQRMVQLLLTSLRGWAVALEAPGLSAIHTAHRGMCRSYDLTDNALILGKLFRSGGCREESTEALELTDQEQREIARLGAPHLATRYWGRYVAFIRTVDGRLHISRDASGGMPVFICRQAHVDLIFSHMEDCLAVLEQPLSINRNHVLAYLVCNRLVSAESGYNEVEQVRAGESVELDRQTIHRSFHWKPVPFAEEALETTESFDDAKTRLRAAVRQSVWSLASCHRRVLLELSGGLDSSIVLSCLASAPHAPHTICFNLYTESLEGDERALARAVSERYGCELKESPFRSASSSRLEDLLATSNLASPQLATMRSESEAAKRQLAQARGIEAIYSGQGGDHLFHRRQSSLVAAEYVERHGLGRSCWPVLLATARMAEKPMTTVLAEAVRFGILKQECDPYAGLKLPPFLSADDARTVMQAAHEQIDHPWVRAANHLPAAKRQQIADLVDSQCFFTASCDYADVVHPLLSQPVIENCLRTPTYLLTHGGVERALARAAFSNDLPRDVIARTTKGDATAYYHTLLVQNLSAIRERLLDGWLVREKLVNRALLERALEENALIDGYAEPYILAAMMAESWARNAAAATAFSH